MRFAVLHHTGIDQPHFDLMFETSETSQLTTFRLQAWPVHQSQAATKLRDHRRAYLTLQGDISMGRGRVERVDEGTVLVERVGLGWKITREDGTPFATIDPLGSDSDESWWFRVPSDSHGE